MGNEPSDQMSIQIINEHASIEEIDTSFEEQQ